MGFRAIIVIVFLLAAFCSVALFSFTARRGERAVVRAATDFYVAMLAAENGESAVAGVTERFSRILGEQRLASTIFCGIEEPNEVRVRSGAAFFGSGTAEASIGTVASQRTAAVFLERENGTWLIDAVDCLPLL